ncbi:MAG: hypothetical protein A2945_03360 [Candidatus Liptonbacteria bacterium RIFCSPLOWO2_01_FULL_52_25]|uniref:Uncharacterized protein n=1 Tax=Candidatus Liptonbacteria bacterium RIFCSPLOWO2_01_FULL_52_25 TaxID=1798650 RepID=A0A1G2CEV5_9BACT|nr:MAG: hypothetical protein A2945_03360 [Candidatus Liptonbacteria bacterium RIFCSPLOWO2_01_FULL_52_25]
MKLQLDLIESVILMGVICRTNLGIVWVYVILLILIADLLQLRKTSLEIVRFSISESPLVALRIIQCALVALPVIKLVLIIMRKEIYLT